MYIYIQDIYQTVCHKSTYNSKIDNNNVRKYIYILKIMTM